MAVAEAASASTQADMSKKKNTDADGENRKTPRINVGIPANWHAVMRRLAGQAKMPVVWWLIDLTAKEAAKAKGAAEELPVLPWIEE